MFPYRVRNYLAENAEGHPPLQEVYDSEYEWTTRSAGSYGGSVPGCLSTLTPVILLVIQIVVFFFFKLYYNLFFYFLFCLVKYVCNVYRQVLFCSFIFPECF